MKTSGRNKAECYSTDEIMDRMEKWRKKFFREEYLKEDKITGSGKKSGMGHNKDN